MLDINVEEIVIEDMLRFIFHVFWLSVIAFVIFVTLIAGFGWSTYGMP
jgi:hypothetical protein